MSGALERIGNIAFTKVEEVIGVNKLPLDTNGLKRDDLPIEEVSLESIVSAVGIDSWEEATALLPSVYLGQLIRGELKMLPPVLLRYDGVFIGIEGSRAIAIEKSLGREKILAHVVHKDG